MFCCALLCALSSFAIISVGKIDISLLRLSSWCLVNVIVLFLTVPWVGLQCVVVVFHDMTYLLLSRLMR